MKQFLSLVTVACVALCFSTTAKADVVLTVDLSVVNQVTISATSGLSAITASGSDTTGFYLEGFYGGAGSALAATLVSGNLTSAQNLSDNSPSLFRGGGGTDPGLNIWSYTNDPTSDFVAGSVAFSGSATFTLDAASYADMLAGASGGDVYFPADTFDDLPGQGIIGQFSVITAIPEPGTFTVLGIGLGLVALRRRR